MATRSVLFFDLASRFGWCEGEPGGTPIFGSERFAPEGSSPEAIGAGAVTWLVTRLSAFRPRTIAWEAPLDPRHMGKRTNIKTARTLLGLPFLIGGVAHKMGVYDLREASIADVRLYLLGRRPPRETAKQEVVARLRGLGFEPQDDNAADALAGWLYVTATMYPAEARDITPLAIAGGAR
jgi:hypothetical protein